MQKQSGRLRGQKRAELDRCRRRHRGSQRAEKGRVRRVEVRRIRVLTESPGTGRAGGVRRQAEVIRGRSGDRRGSVLAKRPLPAERDAVGTRRTETETPLQSDNPAGEKAR